MMKIGTAAVHCFIAAVAKSFLERATYDLKTWQAMLRRNDYK